MKVAATYKDIFKLSAPLIVANFMQTIIGFTDALFLGRVGEVELGAVGIAAIYYLVLVMIGIGLSRGGQILISRRAGEGKAKRIGIILDNFLILQLLFALAMFLLLTFGSNTILGFVIDDVQVRNAALEYIKFRSFGLFFSYLAFAFLAFYAGIVKTTVITYLMVLLAVANVILNYSLIFGNFGLPEMSIGGAGLASTLAEILVILALMVYIFINKHHKTYQFFNFQKLDFSIMKNILNLSLPVMLQYILGLGGWFVFFAMIENMGKRALSVSTIVRWVYAFGAAPAFGFAQGANSIVSNILGQGKPRHMLMALRKTVLFSLYCGVGFALLIVIFPTATVNIFTSDPAIVKDAIPSLYVTAILIIGASISTVIFNGYIGTGDTKLSLLITAIAMVGYLAYATYAIKVLQVALHWAWLSDLVYWGILTIISLILFRSGRWRKIRV